MVPKRPPSPTPPRGSTRQSVRASQQTSSASASSAIGRRSRDDLLPASDSNHPPRKRQKSDQTSLQSPSLNASSSQNPPQTPSLQRRNPPLVDASARCRETQGESSPYTGVLVEDVRADLFKDYPHALTVPIEEMIKAFFRPRGELNIDDVCEELRKTKIITEKGWKSPLVPPSPKDKSEHEIEVFKFIGELNHKILKVYDNLRLGSGISSFPERTTDLVVDGSVAPETNKPNRSHPDAAVQISDGIQDEVEKSLGWDWLTIVCPMEFKKSEVGALDNLRKVVWSMHEVMRNDPRRRFVFGLTIENTTVRFWFHNRANVIASHPFDLHKECEHLVYILVALGTSGRMGLGFDDTMSLHSQKDGENVFDVQVFAQSETGSQPKLYRTVRRITDYTGDVLVGRATRVWKVRRVVNGQMVGENLVLKDTWINDDRNGEHVALNTIREKLEKNGDPRLRHFLTCEAAGWVPASKTTAHHSPDHTLNTHRQAVKFTQVSRLDLSKKPSNPAEGTGSEKVTGVSTGNLPSHPGVNMNVSFQAPEANDEQRVHYRIVFKEVGKPLRLLDTFDQMSFALQGALCGYGAMHVTDHIHRDVSANNILIVERNIPEPCECTAQYPTGASEGKQLVPVIMDFEYMLNIHNKGKAHHIRTGTWHFMAEEVQFKRWRFFSVSFISAHRSEIKALAPWQQHALHDIESIYWVALWVIFKYLTPSVSPVEDYIVSYRSLFPASHIPRKFAPLVIGEALENGLPNAYGILADTYFAWSVFVLGRLTDASVDAFPAMTIVKFQEFSKPMVKGCMEKLAELRTKLGDEQALGGKLEDVRTRLNREAPAGETAASAEERKRKS